MPLPESIHLFSLPPLALTCVGGTTWSWEPASTHSPPQRSCEFSWTTQDILSRWGHWLRRGHVTLVGTVRGRLRPLAGNAGKEHSPHWEEETEKTGQLGKVTWALTEPKLKMGPKLGKRPRKGERPRSGLLA